MAAVMTLYSASFHRKYLYTKKPSSVTQQTTAITMAFVWSLLPRSSQPVPAISSSDSAVTSRNSGLKGRMIQKSDIL